MIEKTIAFVGVGNMGQGIIRGLIATGTVKGNDIIGINEAFPEALAEAAAELGIVAGKPRDLARADVIFLAVKPQDFTDAARMYAEHIGPHQLVISIMAGITLKKLEAELGKVPMVRVMPNLAISVRRSVSSYTPNPYATEADVALACALLSPLGLTMRVPESMISAVIAATGSSPAYLCLMLEALIDTAVANGIPPEMAEQAVLEAFYGTAELLKAAGISPFELRRRVSSKGGTTIAATDAMCAAGFMEAVRAGCAAAVRRSDEMNEAFERE